MADNRKLVFRPTDRNETVAIGPGLYWRGRIQSSDAVSDLKTQINQLSVSVPNATADAVTVLYSGWMPDGTTHTGAVAEALVNANPGKVLTINQTEVYALLDSRAFRDALLSAVGNDSAIYSNLTNGSIDAAGQRIPDSLWDDASRRFAQNASGEVRVLAPLADGTRVFAQTELDALLKNPNSRVWVDLFALPVARRA